MRYRLTENRLRTIISESVKAAINEISFGKARDAYAAACGKSMDDIRQSGRVSDKNQKRMDNLYGHMSDRVSDRFDPNMPVVVVGGRQEGYYTAGDLERQFKITGVAEPFENPRFNDSKTIGYPKLQGYLGPMWDGDHIRYESPEAYSLFST